ncbi:hypothetical protein SDJN03_29577, partial [Cucurbita argyrosperma subsp. sororia]
MPFAMDTASQWCPCARVLQKQHIPKDVPPNAPHSHVEATALLRFVIIRRENSLPFGLGKGEDSVVLLKF